MAAESRETLGKFADTYFWDVFAIICTGVVIFIEIVFVTKIEKTHLLSWNLLNWFTYLFIFYALGLIGDAILGFFPLKGLMEKFLTNEYKGIELELEAKVIKKFKKINRYSDLTSSNLSVTIRNFLEINNIQHRYLSFFSKQRLYENLSILSIINAFLVWIIYFYPNHNLEFHLNLSVACFLSFLSLVTSTGLWQLANKFWFYSCREIYIKFLLFQKKD